MKNSLKKTRLMKFVALGSTALISSTLMQVTLSQADGLSDLKSELESLKYEVRELKSQAVTDRRQLKLAVRPKQRTTNSGRALSDNEVVIGNSIVSFDRGSHVSKEKFAHLLRSGDVEPESRGFTLGISPVADLPGPVHEITISGYIKADVIFDYNQDLGDAFDIGSITRRGDNDHVRLHARQSRFRIRSRHDTSVGEVRTLIETDFFGGGSVLRLRHAWGEWDINSNWTVGAGQTWSNFMPLFDLPDTVDFSGPVGLAFSRQAQVRMTYKSGPIEAAFAIEDPAVSLTNAATLGGVSDGAERLPDFTARMVYSVPGGHKLLVSAVVGEQRIDPDAGAGVAGGNDSAFFWGIIGAGQISIGDAATFTISGGIGDGNGRYLVGADAANNVFNLAVSPNIRTRQFYHVAPSINVSLTETISANAAWGYINFKNKDTLNGQTDYATTVHGNIMWQPADQLKFGIETMWGKRKIAGGGSESAARSQFGAWFFF